MKAMKKNIMGVSPVIAVILMVAITVVLAGVVFLWAQSFTEDTGDTVKTLSVDMDLEYDTTADDGSGDLYVTSLKGDIDWGDYTVLVAGGEIAGQSVAVADPGIATGFAITAAEGPLVIGDSFEIQIVSIADQAVLVKTDVTCTSD